MSRLRKKPPADTPTPTPTGEFWSDFDLEDLRYCLAAGEGAEQIAAAVDS